MEIVRRKMGRTYLFRKKEKEELFYVELIIFFVTFSRSFIHSLSCVRDVQYKDDDDDDYSKVIKELPRYYDCFAP